MLDYIYLVAGLALLIKGADWLVAGASSIARSLRISEFVIGLTVVSFGTSLPELIIGIVAGMEGNPDLLLGNVIGSNIANVLLVLGVASMIHPLAATRGTVWREIPFTFLASVLLIAMLNGAYFHEGSTFGLGRGHGIVLLGFFCGFMYYIAQVIKKDKDREWVGTHESHNASRSTAEVIGGMVGLGVGGYLAVGAAVGIAEAWGVSDSFIGLTVVAIGTSLPELATSAVAAYRRNADIAVGNVVGSNIFNIFVVCGISSLLFPIPFNTVNNVDLAVMMAATLLLFVFMFIGRPVRTIQRREGAFFLSFYVAYIGYVIYRG